MQIRHYSIPALVIVATAALTVAAAACGGSDSTRAAEEYIPELQDLGFQLVDQGRDPFAPENVDTHRALYQDADGRAAIVLVYVEEDETRAEAQYATLSTALEHPPPEFFGAEAEQTETEPIDIGEEQRAFVTATPDQQGNLIWTDIYRSGTAIAIVQVLAMGEDQGDLRRTIGLAIFE